MRRTIVGAVLTASLIAAAPAAAQDYGGGRFPLDGPGYTPTLGIVLQPRGDRIAFRFDTSIWCRDYQYEVTGRRVVAFDGRSYAGSGGGRFAIGTGRGSHVRYSWRLRGQADGTIASGRLVVSGTRFIDGRRTRCRLKSRRRFSARIAAPAPAGAPRPPALAAFGGLSDVQITDGLRGPVQLKVTRSGRRILSRWTGFATCGRGPRADLTNITPSMRIRADGSFSRSKRFPFRYADVLIRYRMRFAGRVSGEAANGTLRMRSRVYTRNGKRLLTRCDSGTRTWTAAMLRPIAPAG